jgi:hypothetical protein
VRVVDEDGISGGKVFDVLASVQDASGGSVAIFDRE